MTVKEFLEAWDPEGLIDAEITWDMSIADELREAARLVEGAEELGENVSYEDAAEYIELLHEQRIDEYIAERTENDALDEYIAENDKIHVAVPYNKLESEVEHAISLAYHDRGGNSWETILRGLVLSAATAAWAGAAPSALSPYRVTSRRLGAEEPRGAS